MNLPLTKAEFEVLDQLMAAHAEHNPEAGNGICMVRSTRKSGGKPVAMICRSCAFEDGVQLYPLAVAIVTKEDLDLYEPPKP